GWRNVPNWKATTFGKPLTIGPQGFRDKAYSLAKPPETKRMLVLGDSFTWGYGVADNEIFTEVLERELNERGQKWEVINTGVSGWGTDLEYLFFRDEGRRFEPDVVVLAYFLGNDWGNSVATIQYGLGKPCFTDTNLTSVTPPILNPGKEYQYNLELDPVMHSIALINATHELCRESDAEFLVLFFGALGVDPGSETDKFAARFMPSVMKQLQDRQVDFIDVDGEFVRSGATSQAVFGGNSDGHWNATGHMLVAGFIFRWLQANPLP
ncbi:MAG: SGNH/GDSL hydrolase family protein, partial [Limisphaerales bacterium]